MSSCACLLPLLLLLLLRPAAGATGCPAGDAAGAAGSHETRGSVMLQRASALGSTPPLAVEEEAEQDVAGAPDGLEPLPASEEPPEDRNYYERYALASGWEEQPEEGNATNATNATEGGGQHDAPPQDMPVPFPPWGLPLPVPCVSYNLSHPLVQKQFSGETLSYPETQQLIQAPSGFGHTSCTAAPGTQVIHTRTHMNMCIQRGLPYTVCFTGSPDSHVLCGIFVAGARGLRRRGGVDCLGGCNEGRSACNVRRHRGSCFTHDVCSLVLDATGFTSHRECGDEAAAAVRGAGRCGGTGRW